MCPLLSLNQRALVNSKRTTFIEEYLKDLNATQAAKRAGYSERTAYSQGQRLLKDDEIQAVLSEKMQARSERTEVTVDAVVAELSKLGFGEEMPRDKIRALELLGRHLGMFTDRLAIQQDGPVVIG